MDGASSPRRTLTSLVDMRPSIAGMRKSLLSVEIFKPRWKPWSPRRVVTTTAVFAALFGVLVVLTYKATKHFAALTPFVRTAAAVVVEEPVVKPAPREAERADAALVRDHRSPFFGGVFTLPPAFSSKDGAYDLVIHFHGNTDLVEESYALSGLNAAVVILNLGNGSGVYEDHFANTLALPDVLARAQTTMEKRGLAHAHLRRLALTAWSAGYGAVMKVLDQPALAEKVDAVLLLDGIHVGYGPGGELQLERLAPFERFAREAVEGKKLFYITHSDILPIGPNGRYAGTHETTDALLRAVGVTRSMGGQTPVAPTLHSIEGVIAKKKLVPLTPESFADQGRDARARVHGRPAGGPHRAPGLHVGHGAARARRPLEAVSDSRSSLERSAR